MSVIRDALLVGVTATSFLTGLAHMVAWSADRQSGWVSPSVTQTDLDMVSVVLRDYETVRGRKISGSQLSVARGKLARMMPGSDVKAGDKYAVRKDVHDGVTRFTIYRNER
jgi:hypothetical protein